MLGTLAAYLLPPRTSSRRHAARPLGELDGRCFLTSGTGEPVARRAHRPSGRPWLPHLAGEWVATGPNLGRFLGPRRHRRRPPSMLSPVARIQHPAVLARSAFFAFFSAAAAAGQPLAVAVGSLAPSPPPHPKVRIEQSKHERDHTQDEPTAAVWLGLSAQSPTADLSVHHTVSDATDQRSRPGASTADECWGGDAFDETAGEPGLLPTKKPSVDSTVVTEGFFDVNGMLALIPVYWGALAPPQ